MARALRRRADDFKPGQWMTDANVWSGNPPPSDKPNLENAYARRTFYFDVSGSGITNGPGCP